MSIQKISLEGRVFGRWTVLERMPSDKRRNARWLVLCICGEQRVVLGQNLTKGLSKSCGCLKAEKASKQSQKHGAYKSTEYCIWAGIKDRCYCVTNKSYINYGGRGIKVCDRWLESFDNFLEDMGPRPLGDYSIDRIDNDGDYSPANCKWATRKEQNRNTRRNRVIEHGGIIACIGEWAELFGIKQTTLGSRLDLGWSMDRALNTPITSR